MPRFALTEFPALRVRHVAAVLERDTELVTETLTQISDINQNDPQSTVFNVYS